MQGISNEIERFIFAHVDSVNLLEILLHMHAHAAKEWTARALAVDLRGNLNSVEQCLELLNEARLIRASASPDSYIYHPENPEDGVTIQALAEAYKIHRHKIFELIFSPMKKARDFAGAFTCASGKDKKERGDG